MKKPKNYYCHKSLSDSSSLPISQHLQVVEKIGEGAFGEVFKVFDHNTSQLKVIKRHKRQSSTAIFLKQNQVMKEMSGSQGFAKVKQFLSQNAKTKNNISAPNTIRSLQTNSNQNHQKQQDHDQSSQELIMMECLGDNLSKIVQKKPVSIFTMKRIAEQLILRLKQLHEKNYVHRDLKPQNILLGNQINPHKIYLVDFGLVSSYRKDPKKIRRMYDGLIGTAKYCPLASHYGNQQFPKDDLESLGYVLVYLVKGQLPWKFPHDMSDQQKFQRMKETKEKIQLNELSGGINCLKKFFTYLKSLSPGKVINYSLILEMFKTESKEQYCFEFCKSNCFYKITNQHDNPIFEDQSFDKNEETKIESFKNININTYEFRSKFKK